MTNLVSNILSNFTKRELYFWGILSLLLVVFAGIKSYNEGMDANVYLYASKQFFQGEDIYSNNLYNFYLYSPFFAAILWPFSILGEFGRAMWGMLNMILFLRLAFLFIQTILHQINITKKIRNWLYFGGIIISFGMVLHNVSLGQITILILWLTFEGLYQIIVKERKIFGGILLGMGVIIKIIPVLALFYLALKKEFKAGLISGITIVFCLILPALFVGIDQDIQLHKNWEQTINPSKKKYFFEFDNGTYSLNAMLPAYFYDFKGNNVAPPTNRPRQIVTLSNRQLELLVQITRIGLALGLIFFVFYSRNKDKGNNLFFIWQFAYLALVTALIFPHQQKYAMLYFVPAGIYFLLNFLIGLQSDKEAFSTQKTLSYISLALIILFSIQGRDIIGNSATEFLDDYHTFGLINILAVALIFIIRPDNSFLSKVQ